MPKITARTTNMPIHKARAGGGRASAPTLVEVVGKLATVFGPSRISAMPRYSASVPMVTAREGSPTRGTSSPLTAPASAPTAATITKIAIIGSLCRYSTPSRALDMPRVDSTDRSISPLMMISAIGRAMIATSPLFRPRLKMLLAVKNSDDSELPRIATAITTTTRPLSHRSAGRSRVLRSSGSTARAPPSQRGGQPDRDETVQHDGHDEQETGDGLVP